MRSNRREQPLRIMQELRVDMWDVRSMLGEECEVEDREEGV